MNHGMTNLDAIMPIAIYFPEPAEGNVKCVVVRLGEVGWAILWGRS